jgi:dihydrodipicolinate synthase/N-acetylneuraminate lyase
MTRGREETPPSSITGVNVAAITPRRTGEVEIDLGAMLDLVDFAGASGAQGVVLFASAGEFVHFTPDERSRYVALAAKRSRIPVIANVSHSTLDAAVMMAEEAAGAGIAAVLIMPAYFYRYPPESVETFCLRFAEQAAKWAPVILHNAPSFADPIQLEIARRLLGTGLFAGMNDSSGDLAYVQELIRFCETNPITVLAGADRIFTAARRAGARGGISGAAAAAPELMIALDGAIQAGRTEVADRLDLRLQEFIDMLRQFPAPFAVREACSVRGLQAGPPAVPLGPELARKCQEFREWFRDWLAAVQRECKDATSKI